MKSLTKDKEEKPELTIFSIALKSILGDIIFRLIEKMDEQEQEEFLQYLSNKMKKHFGEIKNDKQEV